MSGEKDLNVFPAVQMSTYYSEDESSGSDPEDNRGFDPAKVDLEKHNEEFAKLICSTPFSPRIMEDRTFQRYISFLNPCIPLPDFESTKVYCLKFYEKERMKIKQILRNWDGKISLSVEVLRTIYWDYMSLKAHFINDNWERKEWVLGFTRIYHDELPEAILKSLKYYGIEDKIFTVTFKNDGNALELLEMVKSNIQSKKQLELNGRLFHVYSSAALLTSMVHDAFDEMSEILDKIIYIIPWMKEQEQWIISNLMIKRALNSHLRGEFSPEFNKDYNMLSAEEWKTIGEMCELIDKVHTVAKLLFEAKYPTSSTFLINLHDLRVSLRKYASSSCRFIRASAEKMLQNLDKYWKDMFLVMAIAAIMDPRCKMKYLEYLSNNMKGCDDNLQSSTVLQIVQSLYASYATSNLKQVDSESDSNASDCEEDNLPSKRRKEATQEPSDEGKSSSDDIFSHLLGYKEFVQATSQAPLSDLDWYLAEPVHPWDQDFNLLKWWKTASPKYPTLSRMARDLLAIPFTVLTSFDAYYWGERLVDRKLLSAGPLLMNALMCTRSWQ